MGMKVSAGCCVLLQVLIDAVVHAVNEDYEEMAGDFIKLGFLSAGNNTAGVMGVTAGS